eukprot:Phypoly_transcript_20283.p1 GENE.Phypoly_transcript_20283~~Phypoly_transcript_20283.p1  ORF type:complete len:112 (+),score=5.39 Phypoly_transcript_20283:210-545(+)
MIQNCSNCLPEWGCAWCPEKDKCVYTDDESACYVYVFSCPFSQSTLDVPKEKLYLGFAIPCTIFVVFICFLFIYKFIHTRSKKKREAFDASINELEEDFVLVTDAQSSNNI